MDDVNVQTDFLEFFGKPYEEVIEPIEKYVRMGCNEDYIKREAFAKYQPKNREELARLYDSDEMLSMYARNIGNNWFAALSQISEEEKRVSYIYKMAYDLFSDKRDVSILDYGCGSAIYPFKLLFQGFNNITIADIPHRHFKFLMFLCEKYKVKMKFLPLEGDASLIEKYDYTVCFPAGTRVYGNKNIEDIKIGDCVYNSFGNNQIVKNIFQRNYNGKFVNLKILGLQNIEITEEHPILICNFKRIHRKSKPYSEKNIYEYKKTSESWKKAKDLKIGDYVKVPRVRREEDTFIEIRKGKAGFNSFGDKRKKNKIKVSADLAFVLGLWVAEGTTSKEFKKQKTNSIPYIVNFHLGSHEYNLAEQTKKIVKEQLGVNASISLEKKYHRCILQIYNKDFAIFLKENFGYGAKNKYIGSCIKNAKKDIIIGFIKGLLIGDGDINRNTLRITTVSKTLAFDLAELLYKLGITPSTHFRQWESYKFKNQPRVEKKIKSYSISFPKIFWDMAITNTIKKKKNRLYLKSKIFNEYVYLPVQKIKFIKRNKNVYNIETEDNTYCVPFIVHNCSEVLEHVWEPEEVLVHMIEHMKDDGWMYLSTFFDDMRGQDPTHLVQNTKRYNSPEVWLSKVRDHGLVPRIFDMNGVPKGFQKK